MTDVLRGAEDGPSWREFARLEATIEKGFSGTHDRLDDINGRVGKGEVDRENLRTRIVGIEKTIFHRRVAGGAGSGESWAGAMSSREKALVGLGFVALSIALKLLEMVGTELWKVLTHPA